jgi:hypothetical protein
MRGMTLWEAIQYSKRGGKNDTGRRGHDQMLQTRHGWKCQMTPQKSDTQYAVLVYRTVRDLATF